MIYVSYSREDRTVVQRVCQSLVEKGVQLFVDNEKLTGGDYAKYLKKQIESAEAILFFYSENTEKTTWVKHEIEYSLSKSKRIVTVLLSEPKKDNWLNFYLGTTNWITVDRENISIITDKIKNALETLNGEIKSNQQITTGIVDEHRTIKYPHSDKKKHAPQFWKKKKVCYGIIVMLCVVALFLIFSPIYVESPKFCGSPNSICSSNPSLNDTISYSNINYGQTDSLTLQHRVTEMRIWVDEQLLILQQEIENPNFPESDNNYQSIIREIYIILGISFPQVSINTPQGRLNAFYKYRKMVYSALDRKIAEMELQLKERSNPYNLLSQGGQIDSSRLEGDEVVNEYSSDNVGLVWLLAFISFLVGSGLMFLLLRAKKLKKDNIKLSSDIASKISIDGEFKKEIASREVYTTHLEKGEYLIDFEDKQDENRHKLFNHVLTTKECRLVFANFLEESSQNEKNIKCFIAGSKKLQQERDALRAVTCVMYNKWDSKNFRILSYTFEDFKKEHTLVPPQELYNKFIEREADWALFIIDGEIGGITSDEYRVAMDSFKKNGRPKILALAKVGSENNENVAEIKDEINKEHQCWTDYTDIVSLKYIFESTLNWDLIRMFQH